MTSDNAIWWLKLKAKQKQKEGYTPKENIPIFPVNQNKPIEQDKTMVVRPVVNPVEKNSDNKRKFQTPSLPTGKKDYVKKDTYTWSPPQDKNIESKTTNDYKVNRTSKTESFGTAYKNARLRNEREFIWNHKTYNTKNSGTPNQQYNLYGNTDKFIENVDSKRSRDYISKLFKDSDIENPYGIISTGDEMDKMSMIYNYSNQPWTSKPGISTLLIGNRGGTYSPILNKIEVDSKETFYAELAHSYRTKEDFFRSMKAFPEVLASWLTGGEQSDNYFKKEYEEYKTHSVTEPAILNVVRDKNKNIDDVKLLEKFYGLGIPGYSEQTKKFIYDNYPLWTKDITTGDEENEKEFKFHVLGIQNHLKLNGFNLPKSTKSDGKLDGVWGDETRTNLINYLKLTDEIKSKQRGQR